MQILLLEGNNLRDLDAAGCHRGWLGQLTELDLSRNRFAAVPPVLAAATALRQLRLCHQRLFG
jgi:Leucine-rich repeat (LRR) protein